jgi:hypothetical protein
MHKFLLKFFNSHQNIWDKALPPFRSCFVLAVTLFNSNMIVSHCISHCRFQFKKDSVSLTWKYNERGALNWKSNDRARHSGGGDGEDTNVKGSNANCLCILLFHYCIMQWIWRGGGVNLKRIDAYAVLGWENDTKFHVFAIKHKVNTQNEQSAHSDNCVLF